jgi:hypothetical protein
MNLHSLYKSPRTTLVLPNHIPIELAYGGSSPLGVVGNVYAHATTGDFTGRPSGEEFRQRAEALAVAHGIE